MSLANLSNLNTDLNLTVSSLKYKSASTSYIQFLCKGSANISLSGEEAIVTIGDLPFYDIVTNTAQVFPTACVACVPITQNPGISFSFLQWPRFSFSQGVL